MDAKAIAGKDLFTAYCGRCHGTNAANGKSGGSLEGLFQREKLANGKPVNDQNVMVLIEDGHAEMKGTTNWLDAGAAKALLVYLKSLL